MAGHNEWSLTRNASNQLVFTVYDVSGNPTTAHSTGTLLQNTWYHIAAVQTDGSHIDSLY